MAKKLSHALTLFTFAADHPQPMRPLGVDEISGGTFTYGGDVITFKDGRAPLRGIAVTRTAFHAAIEAIKRPPHGSSR
jgi:hypothetical protein